MRVSFVRWKFNRMLAVATVVMAVNFIVMLSGSVIVGNLVGAEGLAGLNACTPIFGAASFLASLLSVGTALVFSRAMGEFDERRAAGVFSQSLVLAIGLGALVFAAIWLGGPAYLDATGVAGAVRLQAEHYLRWQAVAMALLPSVLTLEALVYADGDGAVALLAGGLHVMGAIGLSAFYTWRTGDAGGAALGTAVTMMAVLVACSAHFCRANNHLRFRDSFSWRDVRATVAASLADSTIYLCWGVLIFVVNRFAVVKYGQDVLPLVALAASVVEFSIVFDGVGEALIPLGGMYDGEGNTPALRELANWSAFVATLEGVVFGVLFFVLAPWIARYYGDFGPSVEDCGNAVGVVRILAFAMPFMGLLMMMNTHYLVVHHLRFAVSVTVMKDFVCPCIGVLALGGLGEAGIWFGFAAGYVVAAAYPFLFVWMRYGRERFPWLIGNPDGRSVNFAARETEHGRTVLRECFVAFEEGSVRIVVRDNGPARTRAEGKYLNTLGCNRTEYRFDIIPPQKELPG